MSNFKLGDIAIGQHFTRDIEYNGMECEIIGELGLHPVLTYDERIMIPVRGYAVKWADGNKGVTDPYNLRKKYDGDDTVDWEDCVWKPTEELA